MNFSIERTQKGKPCILFNGHKYRENRILNSGEVSWRCLGRTCGASLKTDAERSAIVNSNEKHSGDHPVTMRTLSPCATTPVSRPSSSSPSSVGIPLSPLVSHAYNSKQITNNSSTQTDDLHLKEKDKLVDRIRQLTHRQSCLVEKIQELTLQLEKCQQNAREPVNVLHQDCQTDLFPVDMQKNDTSDIEGAGNQLEDKAAVFQVELQAALDRVKTLEDSLSHPCENCKILRQETSNMITTMRIIEEENRILRANKPHQEQHLATSLDNSQISPLNQYPVTPEACEDFTSGFIEVKPKKCRKRNANRKIQSQNRINHIPPTSKYCKKTEKSVYRNERKSKLRSRTEVNIKHISVYGDSHVRHLAPMMQDLLEPQTQVCGVCKPSAGLLNIVPTASPPSDHCCILMAGTNDVAAGNEDILFTHYEKVIQDCISSSRAVLVCSLPTRYDLMPGCRVNQTIRIINNYLDKLCGRYEGVYLLDIGTISRYHYTAHGMHLRRSGKRILARLIVENLALLSLGTTPASTPRTSAPKMTPGPATFAEAVKGTPVQDNPSFLDSVLPGLNQG